MSRTANKPLILTTTPWHLWHFLLPITAFTALILGLDSGLRDALILTACFLGFGGMISGIISIALYFGERVSIDGEGVHIECRRKDQYRILPWTDYMFVYTLPAYKHTWLLFTPVMLDKDAQLAVLNAALGSRMFRYPYFQSGGHLLLSSGPVLSMRTLYRRLPPHIRVMPPDQCAKT